MGKRDEFDQALKDKIEFCDSQEREYNGLIIDLTTKIAHWNTVLAKCTADHHQAAGQHKEAATEYVRSMKECCDNKNTYRSELCALGKIRGELNNMAGDKVFITDCEVGAWEADTCDKPCGGGRVTSTRKVITHRVGLGL